MYHHWSDLIYLYTAPHWNTLTFIGLFVFIWIPFLYNLKEILLGNTLFIEKGWSSLFFMLFIMSGTVSIRKFYKANSNGFVHLTI